MSRIPEHHIYFGIPRGGTIVAGLAAAQGYVITDDPNSATAYLDDIVDSGATKAKWSANGKPFYSLFEKGDSWLRFPWDMPNEAEGEDVVRRMLQLIGEDPNREGLRDTPRRVVKSWKELFQGYWQSPSDVLIRDFDSDGYDQMIVCRNIEFYSTCEHHLQPFFGKAHVGYLPNKRVLGLSKTARLVEVFARRLQIQERLTHQVAHALWEHLQPRGVGVVMEAKHFCMICRGVNKQESEAVTSALEGCFHEAPVRTEFFNLINGH